MPFLVLAHKAEEPGISLSRQNDRSYIWNDYGIQCRIIVFGPLETPKNMNPYFLICGYRSYLVVIPKV